VTAFDKLGLTVDDSRGIAQLKLFLQQKFHTKDLKKLRHFLEIEVVRSQKGINLSQRKYALDLLEETGLLVDTPMDPNKKLVKDECELFENPSRYRRLVGKLNYLIIYF
jgi:hypothetical protein